jgi:hypothetical protein
MENIKNFNAETEEALWQQLSTDLTAQQDILEYTAQLNQNGRTVLFNIDVDLGGGFEGGFETTTFSAPVSGHSDFRLHIYPQDWVNEIGKFFGLEDVELGIPELDKAFIIKTNQPEKLKAILAEPSVQSSLLNHPTIHIKLAPAESDADAHHLSVYFYQAITDPAVLREVYHLLISMLDKLSQPKNVQTI